MQAIVLVDKDFGIAKNGKQVCMIKDDLKRFKFLTYRQRIIYGRKTLEAFPNGDPLRCRVNICLSRTLEPRGDLTVASTDAEIDIGGESVYKLFYDDLQIIFLTLVHHSFGTDQFFPHVDQDPGFQVYNQSDIFTDESTGLQYQYITYVRWQKARH